MHLKWKSHKGSQRVHNSDAVALYQNDAVFLAILVDSAEKNGELHKSDFSTYWSQMVMTECVKFMNYSPRLKIDANEVIHIIKEGQKSLRNNYLHNTASYIIILVDKNNYTFTGLHCGDCLFGTYKDNGTVNWLIEPHNVYQQYKKYSIENDFPDLLDNTRFTLTRCLNARRFSQPEVNQFYLPETTQFILSTDGYWAEYVEGDVSWDSLEDDASVLTIDFSATGMTQIESDCDNLADYTISY
ncbi:hypothetical protein H4F46_17575 [Pectobacterium brasiliense]|uniref:hypothetical protein n=1 Tax=Pectobacterium brasiliense TaxID=180957 RepID=UPI0004E76C5E|nr:hypothetical protein [Pectobacterium brasiliense]KFF71181.1 hypothetical protein IW00_01075 [Pectobacterium brasiliense]MBN3116701.1 hypothetical protein [Pectobacterium brasiliense]MBN3131880.1 hypothetical protein [Pectobacterium brasiliense]